MMKRIFPSFLLLLALAACGCAADATTDAAANKTSARNGGDDEAAFRKIFNGRDLTGWVYGTARGAQRKSGAGYQVRPEDGVLYCTAADGGQLFTEKAYDDFALRFEFRLSPGSNNGVAIRAPLDGHAAYEGLEIQILDDTAEKYASLRPEQYHGSVYNLVPAERGHLKPVGEWNRQEIRAQGSRITVTLNGHKIVDADLSQITDEAKREKHPGLRARSGHIGFLGHGSPVEFKNIRIKELEPVAE